MLKKQAGQALPMALILLLVGSMLIIPVLNLTTTNLKATLIIDQKTRNFYAADAGIDDGLWKVRYNYIPTDLLGQWDETTYATYEETPYAYDLYDNDDPDDEVTVNNRKVKVEMKPIWVLDGLEEPTERRRIECTCKQRLEK